MKKIVHKSWLHKYLSSGFVLLAAALLFSLAGCGSDTPGSPVIAKVNSSIISHDDVRAQMSFMGLGNNPAALNEELRKAVLDEIAQRLLILQEAASMSIVLEPDELASEEKAIRGEMSVELFENALSIQGLDYAQWRRILSEELLSRKVLDLVISPQVKVTPEEVKKYYQEHSNDFVKPAGVLAYHVVLPNRELALKVKQAIKDGQSFSQACYAIGMTPPNEGLPVWLERGHMPEKFEDKIFKTRKDEVGGPFNSNYGFHIIMVLETRKAGKASLEQVSEEIQQRLTEERKQDLASQWLDSLTENANIWYDPGFLKHGRLGVDGS